MDRRVLLEPPRPGSQWLRVVFDHCGDRVGHTLERVENGRVMRLLTSVEGSSADPSPPSPPLQQLHVESRAGESPEGETRVALLVGMAGRNHWSLSVELASDGTAVVLDVACRVSDPSVALQSRYRWASDPDPVVGAAAAAGRRRQGWNLVPLAAASLPAASIHAEPDGWRIVPAGPVRGTVRWKYQIALDVEDLPSA